MKKLLALFLALITALSLTTFACGTTPPDDDGDDGDTDIVEFVPPENVRPDTDVVYVENGDGTITFGMYPQTKVTDTALINKLNQKKGSNPTANAPGLWTAQDFVNVDNNHDNTDYPDWMFFIDVQEGGNYYRGIYFTEYRLYNAVRSTANYQERNGYLINTVYWFKYEPILWQVLTTKQDGSKFLFCDMAIDCVPFDNDGKCDNDYSNSTGRKFTNENFLYYAFTPAEIAMIPTVEVDNSARSTGEGSNVCACENTLDKVFMLSIWELTEPAYGFKIGNEADPMRSKYVTDYGISQGSVTYTKVNGKTPTSFGTRSPNPIPRRTRFVGNNGTYNEFDACCTWGFVPGLYVKAN